MMSHLSKLTTTPWKLSHSPKRLSDIVDIFIALQLGGGTDDIIVIKGIWIGDVSSNAEEGCLFLGLIFFLMAYQPL